MPNRERDLVIRIGPNPNGEEAAVVPGVAVMRSGTPFSWMVDEGSARIILPAPCSLELEATPEAPACAVAGKSGQCTYAVLLTLSDGKRVGSVAVIIIDP
jgi:hypothetical protein